MARSPKQHPATATAQFPRVAVLVPASTGWGRGIIKGIAAFANHQALWQLQVEPEGERRRLPHGWRGDGIIARLSTPATAREILAAGVPVVNVSSIRLAGPAAKVPQVCNDVRACGTLAARHLLERGLRHFAYVGLQKLAYVREHREAFAATLAEHGFGCQVLGLGDRSSTGGPGEPLRRWLGSLPKPVGVLTWNHAQGRAVIHACRQVRLLVPEDVAVLSGNDDPLLCETCQPPLSGIAVAAEQIGERAAAVLAAMMQGKSPPSAPIHVPPIGIITRQSTDTMAVGNLLLLQALGYIREHATEPIRINDVLRAVPISRRSLERFFHDLLGRSPAEEIRRVRIERAKQLLATTDLPIPKVAQASGFGTGEYLATLFRQEVGMTPLKYRAAARGH